MHSIKKYCEENDIKLNEFAAKISVSPAYLSQIICGYRRPSVDVALLIIKKSHNAISFDDLFAVKQSKKNKGQNQTQATLKSAST